MSAGLWSLRATTNGQTALRSLQPLRCPVDVVRRGRRARAEAVTIHQLRGEPRQLRKHFAVRGVRRNERVTTEVRRGRTSYIRVLIERHYRISRVID